MQVGISTASMFLRLNSEDVLPLYAAWGVPVAEVFLTTFSEYDPAFARRASAEKGAVRVHSVHTLTTQFEPQLYAAHPRVRADAYALLDRLLACAAVFGAKRYTFHGIARMKRTFREDLGRLGEETAKIASYCAERGVALCLENVEWSLYCRPKIFSAMRAAYPSLMGVLDVKQARISGYDWREYVDEMGDRISHVHVSDFDGRNCLPGRGKFEFGELFARLKDVGFDGPVLIECYREDFSSPEELRASFCYLAELAEKYR